MKTFKFIVIFVLIFIAALSAYFFLRTPQNKTVGIPTPRPVAQNFEKDYSFLNKIKPGESTTGDVIKINGAPSSISKKEDETFYYYETPSKDYKNLVAFKNNKEIYAVENIFGNYRGSYKSFQTAYGDPGLVLYSNRPFIWRVFLSQGVGIEGNDKDISKILYFVPQIKEEFLSSVAKDLNLFQEPNHEVLHP